MSIFSPRPALCHNCGGVTYRFAVYFRANGSVAEVQNGCQFCRAPISTENEKAYRDLEHQRWMQKREAANARV